MSGTRETILVVEDNDQLRLAIERALQVEGFDVITAADGIEAVELSKTSNPDLVVLDYELPRLSGSQVCRQIREFSEAYVVMLTGRSTETEKVLSLSMGADDYITKPFSFPELMARVHAIFRRPRRMRDAKPNQRSFGSLELDLSKHLVTIGSVEVDVTQTEFNILEMLTREPGVVVSRQQFLKELWNTDWNGEDHFIDVHVHNLRKKLKKYGFDSSIATVRGVGFRLAEAATD